MNRQIAIYENAEVLAIRAAEHFVRLAGEAVAARGRFVVSLAGGRTPNAMYHLLATQYRYAVPWPAIEFFWVDERHVPPSHPDSNFGAARTALLGRLTLRDTQVHRVLAELPNAAEAAGEYEQALRNTFTLQPGDVPSFDLVLLGMGGDAHVASLFPENPALKERERLVVAPWVETLQSHRITMTLPVLNRGAVVLFVVSGAGKADALHAVLDGEEASDARPATLVRPAGEVIWMIDRAAAARLEAR